MICSPSDIEVMIHCYACVGPHPRIDAPAVRETITRFLACDLIVGTGDDVYKATKRGAAWVSMFCSVGLPQPAWVDMDQQRLFIDGRVMSFLEKETP